MYKNGVSILLVYRSNEENGYEYKLHLDINIKKLRPFHSTFRQVLIVSYGAQKLKNN